MNTVNLIGRIAREIEVRYTTGAEPTAVARFPIAIDRPVKQGKEKQTDFPNIIVFGKRAENCEKYLAKGRLVGIEGRLQTGSYTNKDGVKVYTTDVVANRVDFIDWGEKSAQNANQSATDGNMGIPEGFAAITDEDIPF